MRVTWWAYRLVRPVVRPVMRRLRTFLVGRLHDEIASSRDEIASSRDEIAVLRTEVAALHAALERTSTQREVATAVRVQAVVADALATLALDREREPRG